MGVAISTTGDEHRLGLLARCVEHWAKALGDGTLIVTVDGDEDACRRVREALDNGHVGTPVYQVGQGADVREGRMGVAVNKNTGIEILMEDEYVEHLFLSDDDTWPKGSAALAEHINFPNLHSMVCWGQHRLISGEGYYANWTWPRGVMLYIHRTVIDRIGGMDERFGLGGHEHAEFSRRVHQAELTAAPFISPPNHAKGDAFGAADHWHCEDMPRVGESIPSFRRRKASLTTINPNRDWDTINQIMDERDGDTSKVPYKAYLNGRESATLFTNP